MIKRDLKTFFEDYMKKEPLFLDKKALQTSFLPENILHREKELEKVAHILAPSIRGERPSNIFIYGKTGTGKTLTIKHLSTHLKEACRKNDTNVKIIYINCKLKKVADTEYRLIAHLGREFGKEIPVTGLPTEEVYTQFFSSLDEQGQIIIVVLDEIDQLIKKAGDNILYNLTRVNEDLKKSQLSIVGISNDLMFTDSIDPRSKSSLAEEELVFAPYNALQLKDILKSRSQMAFRENTLAEGVLEKCAAYAAREHGDARRALELLRVSGEIAERNNSMKVEIAHIDMAESKIEDDWITELIETQPKQFQSVLYSTMLLNAKGRENIFTGEVYTLYKEICNKTKQVILTQRRVSDIIAELDMLGIINAQVLSKGRYGRTRQISLSLPKATAAKIKSILSDSLGVS